MSDGASLVSLEAQAEPAEELLRAPASGQPCVHWRLRVVEHLTARTELVHDLASPEMFELAWGGAPDAGRLAGPHPPRSRDGAHRGDADAAPRGDAGRGGGGARVRLPRRGHRRGGDHPGGRHRQRRRPLAGSRLRRRSVPRAHRRARALRGDGASAVAGPRPGRPDPLGVRHRGRAPRRDGAGDLGGLALPPGASAAGERLAHRLVADVVARSRAALRARDSRARGSRSTPSDDSVHLAAAAACGAGGRQSLL